MLMALSVALGGFCGAVSRFAVSGWTKDRFSTSFPVATFIVNSIGSFLLGYFVSFGLEGNLYAFLGIGFCGAFTTFSTFKWESNGLLKNGLSVMFYTYTILTYTVGFIAALLGFFLGNS
ncbi:fluoride efflux transporter FluC [Bacillus seohaeanensis]|jgi:fluoride exporter|uniref:Fluoride-specific ion channel FluC n=1 Tax=Bacillus seohaeanensis TaxID=284580 RepID=A0ABW5RTW6_9BACI